MAMGRTSFQAAQMNPGKTSSAPHLIFIVYSISRINFNYAVRKKTKNRISLFPESVILDRNETVLQNTRKFGCVFSCFKVQFQQIIFGEYGYTGLADKLSDRRTNNQ